MGNCKLRVEIYVIASSLTNRSPDSSGSIEVLQPNRNSTTQPQSHHAQCQCSRKHFFISATLGLRLSQVLEEFVRRCRRRRKPNCSNTHSPHTTHTNSSANGFRIVAEHKLSAVCDRIKDDDDCVDRSYARAHSNTSLTNRSRDDDDDATGLHSECVCAQLLRLRLLRLQHVRPKLSYAHNIFTSAMKMR